MWWLCCLHWQPSNCIDPKICVGKNKVACSNLKHSELQNDGFKCTNMLEVIVLGSTDNDATCIPDQTHLSNEAKWLLLINFLYYVTMKKCIHDIKLIKEPMSHSNHGDKKSCHVSNGWEGATIIKAINPRIDFNNYASSKVVNMSINTHLDNVYSAATIEEFVWRQEYQLPSVTYMQRQEYQFPSVAYMQDSHLIDHSRSLLRMQKDLRGAFWTKDRSKWKQMRNRKKINSENTRSCKWDGDYRWRNRLFKEHSEVSP